MAPAGASVGPSGVVHVADPTTKAGRAEPRFFPNGRALLGYLQGRPGIVGVLEYQPGKPPPGAGRVRRPKPGPGVVALVEALPMVQESPPERRQKLNDTLLMLWIEAELWGVTVMFEIDYAS